MYGVKYVQLNEEILRYFEYLDMYDSFDELSLPGTFAIGATVRDEETEKDVPAGVIVVADEGDMLIIKWLYVERTYRGMGIGEKLVSLIFKESHARGYGKLMARITDRYKDNGLMWEPESFFEDCTFKGFQEDFAEWEFPLGALYGKKNGYKHTDKELTVKSLSELGRKRTSELFEMIGKKYGFQLNVDKDTMRSLMDAELSYVWVQDKKLCGVVITRKKNENIYPMFFVSDREEDAVDFASAVIELSEDAVSIGDRLHVVCRMESGEQVMRDLELLSEPIGVELYKAKVEKRI